MIFKLYILNDFNIIMIDIGSNLTDPQFKSDLYNVLVRAEESNIKSIIVTGTNLSNSIEAYELVQEYPKFLYSTAGVHPHDAKTCNQNTISELENLLKKDNVVAVGECGLDFDRNYSPPEIQKIWFGEQLKLADRLNKPVFVHERAAFSDVYQILRQYPNLKAVIHCFTGTENELDAYLNAGYYIGITRWLCDNKKGSNLKCIVSKIPLDKLLIETDSPYIKPKKAKGKSRNEPAYLRFIAEELSSCMNIPIEDIISNTTKNAQSFFNLS
jgi:TatD DNase family protein